uniref:Putative tick transposon n=1 Tax=Rhipicephalus microplus TaxID=6941 RepID=A0A6G5A169_RHIMP
MPPTLPLFDRWIEHSGTAQEYDDLRELLIREQFLTSCHPSLSLYLKERKAESLEGMLESADQFLEAQRGTDLAKVKECPEDSKNSAPEPKKRAPESVPRCFLCNRVGHRASNCRTNFTSPMVLKCFKCGQTGHKADACRNGASQTHQVSCVQAAPKSDNNAVTDGFVELKMGRKFLLWVL